MNNLAVFDTFQFGTSAMVAKDLEGLGGYRTLEYEDQAPIKPINCCFSRVFQASICIGMSLPSLHTESTDSVIARATSHAQYLRNEYHGMLVCSWSLQHVRAACLVYCDNDSLHNSLVRCSVTSQGAKAIADGLLTNTSLKSLE